MGGAPHFATDGVKVELALGKQGALGPGLGKVFEDFPPDGFLTTVRGPEDSGRAGFACWDGGLGVTLETDAAVEAGLDD